MTGFASSNEAIEQKQMSFEEMKINLDMKRLDLEKARLESEEPQKKEERQNQYNMMQMILSSISSRGNRQQAATGNHSYSQWQQPQRTGNNSRSSEDEEFNVSFDSSEHSYYNF
jgi:hypothetical protein